MPVQATTENLLLQKAELLQERLNLEETRIRAELKPVQQQVEELTRKTAGLSKQRNQIALEREKLGLELDLLLRHLKDNRERIRRRAITLYRRTDRALLENALRVEDPVAFVDQLAYALKVVAGDKRFFHEMTGKIRDVTTLREEKRKSDEELSRLEDELKAEHARLDGEQTRLQRILSDLHRAGQALEQEMAEYREGRGQIEAEVNEIRRKPAMEILPKPDSPVKEPPGKDKPEPGDTIQADGGAAVDLAWPLVGDDRRVLSFFGRQNDPGLDVEFNNPGIDIRAKSGESVLAALDGVVRYRGRMKGMGNVVMIESPRGVVTLYSMLGETEVGMGQRISAGEPLGQVGPAPARDKPPFLHFEVRKNGVPVDPMDYF